MDMREKLEFILYQMKIMIKKKDMIRLLIVSRKITKKSFVDPNLEDLEILYHVYLYILHHSNKEYIQCATSLLRILDLLVKDPVPEVLNPLPNTLNPGPTFEPRVPLSNLDQLFALVLFYTLQSPTSAEKSTLLKNLHTENKYSRFLSNNNKLKTLLDHYRNNNLMSTSIEHYGALDSSIYQEATEAHFAENRTLLRKNLIRHNVAVAGVFYKRARLLRLSQLFGCEKSETEEVICDMVTDGEIVAKIDRLDGIVVFGRNKMTERGELCAIESNKGTISRGDEEILDEWVDDVNKLMDKVDQTCSLIHREEENFK